MNAHISQLLNEIQAKTNWSEALIAQKLKVSQPTVNRIRKSRVDCKGSTWAAIIELHKSIFDGLDK